MSTLTGQYISQSYGGVIHLSTNTGIVAGTYTTLEDGLGTSLGWAIKTGGILSGSQLTASVFGTASWANNATNAITASFALNVPTSSVFPYTGSAIITGSLIVSGTISQYRNPNNSVPYAEASINGVNIGIGRWSASAAFTAISASSNTALGYEAMVSNSNGFNNTAVGYQALYSLFPDPTDPEGSDSFRNTAVGYQAGWNQRVFSYNTYVGAFAGRRDQGEGNTAIGDNALRGGGVFGNVGGWYNTAIGRDALMNISGALNYPFSGSAPTLISGLRNIAVGASAGVGIVQGSDNITIGYETLYIGDQPGGYSRNIALGNSAIRNHITGSDNIAIGVSALGEHRSGSSNLFVGSYAGTSYYFGSRNTAIGIEALRTWGSGQFNTALGNRAAPNFESGSGNIFIGQESANQFISGNNNIFIVSVSGSAGNTGVTSGNANTIIGNNITGLSSTLSNNIILADGSGNIRARYSGSWTLETALKLTPQNPLPANSVGTLAVSGSNLYYNNGSAWSQIN